MLDDEKEPDVVVEDGSETEQGGVDETPSQVTIDLDKKEGSTAKAESTTQVPVKKSDDYSKLNNTIAYQTRKMEQALREIAELKASLAGKQKQSVQEPDEQDEIDREAQRDWKKGVKLVVKPEIHAEIEAEFKRRELLEQEKQRVAKAEAELDKSKNRVLEKYPELNDEDSQVASIYRQVLNEDASLLSNQHGPEIAMYRAEERMRQMGLTPASAKPFVDKEVARLARAGASNIAGKQSVGSNKITLTKDQKQFCDHHGISYENYAKNLKSQNGFGGVEV